MRVNKQFFHVTSPVPNTMEQLSELSVHCVKTDSLSYVFYQVYSYKKSNHKFFIFCESVKVSRQFYTKLLNWIPSSVL